MSKHTPGPWTVSELDAVGNVSEFCIFIEPNVAVIERKTSPENDMPDARLIAAAPEMLEALKSARDALAQVTAHPMSFWDCSQDVAALDLVIAKAEGQQ